MTAAYRPVVLCVLDGWGIAPDSPWNAATRADTPRLDAILRDHPNAKLEASGVAVGLPAGVMGNSEVGHLTMGAGYAAPRTDGTTTEPTSAAATRQPSIVSCVRSRRPR